MYNVYMWVYIYRAYSCIFNIFDTNKHATQILFLQSQQERRREKNNIHTGIKHNDKWCEWNVWMYEWMNYSIHHTIIPHFYSLSQLDERKTIKYQTHRIKMTERILHAADSNNPEPTFSDFVNKIANILLFLSTVKMCVQLKGSQPAP